MCVLNRRSATARLVLASSWITTVTDSDCVELLYFSVKAFHTAVFLKEKNSASIQSESATVIIIIFHDEARTSLAVAERLLRTHIQSLSLIQNLAQKYLKLNRNDDVNARD